MITCKKLIAVLCFSFLSTIFLKAQDVIIKNDRSEIKCKVMEITEAVIKYKIWGNQDGPVYNINKANVFMIAYANGQREIIKQEVKTTPVQPAESGKSGNSDLSSMLEKQTQNDLDTSVDYKTLKVKYKPSRFYVGLQSPPLSLGYDYEYRIVKNILNIGASVMYGIYPSVTGTSSTSVFIYGNIYAPINRLTGKYEQQDKGLFAFANAGYQYTSTTINYSNKTETLGAGGFTWRAGADYYFTKKFGVTFFTYEFSSVFAGVTFHL